MRAGHHDILTETSRPAYPCPLLPFGENDLRPKFAPHHDTQY